MSEYGGDFFTQWQVVDVLCDGECVPVLNLYMSMYRSMCAWKV